MKNSRNKAGRIVTVKGRLHRVTTRRKRVFLLQTWWIEEVLAGVARYGAERNWIIDCDMRSTHRLPAAPWCGDGMIVSGDSPEAVEFVRRSPGVAIVDMEPDADRFGAPKVFTADEEIGRIAAEHLLALGFRHFNFVRFSGQANPGGLAFREFPTNSNEMRRAAGFRAAVMAAGAEFLSTPIQDLARAVPVLPRPMAIMASNDQLALDVVRVLEDCACMVPEEFAVIGVNDTPVLCDFASVPLSSVNCNHERRGYEAAALLDRLMSGARPPQKPRLVPPAGVTVRRSTDTVAISDVNTARVLRFLRDHYRRQINISDVLREVKGPVWRAQKLFRVHVGCTMIAELTRLRVNCAQCLLADGKNKMEVVARASGFSSRFHFTRAFRRLSGQTPVVFRQRLRTKS